MKRFWSGFLLMTMALGLIQTEADARAELRAVRNEKARRDLGAFMPRVVAGYKEGAHLGKLIECLHAVERGEIRRLMVFEPPRHSKSMHVSQGYPCWRLGQRPSSKIVLASYAEPIALTQSRAARDMFVSPACREIFPEVFHRPAREGQRNVITERQAAQEWGTVQGGNYFAVGVGGGLTGRGYDLGIIDDPHKDRDEADSARIREKVWDWYRSTFYTRRTPDAAIILCMTRWHPNDLAGRLLNDSRNREGEEWHVLEMPAIDDGGRPLWPEQWPIEELEKIRVAVGPREWSSLYQQSPVVSGGAIFKRAWWEGANRFDPREAKWRNSCVARVHSWDTAEKTEEGNAYSACAVGELTPQYQVLLRAIHRDRLEFPALVERIERVASADRGDGKLKAVLIEEKSSGVQVIQSIRALGPQWLRELVVGVQPKGDKTQRGYSASVWCTNGVVWLPMPCEAAPWLYDFEEEFFSFPASVFKDQVDALTQLLWYWHHLLAAGLGITVHG